MSTQIKRNRKNGKKFASIIRLNGEIIVYYTPRLNTIAESIDKLNEYRGQFNNYDEVLRAFLEDAEYILRSYKEGKK